MVADYIAFFAVDSLRDTVTLAYAKWGEIDSRRFAASTEELGISIPIEYVFVRTGAAYLQADRRADGEEAIREEIDEWFGLTAMEGCLRRQIEEWRDLDEQLDALADALG